MRTLKKTLCLVLCLAMMAGLCCVAASADFNDAEEIVNKEAVDVLTGIGVINGIEQEDGTFNFDPNGTLTRAQACKIITFLLGDEDLGGTCNFTDCQGHWAEGYIAYCANAKIVAGYGDGTFGPDAKLTGAAWAKMLLCALGYKAENENMVGADWEISVAKLAKKTGLINGIEKFDGSAEISRDEACLLAFNALNIPMVDYYSNGVTIKTGDVEIVTGETLHVTGDYLGDNFKLVKADGTLNKVADNDEYGYAYYEYYKTTDTLKKAPLSEKYYTDTVVAEFVGKTTEKQIAAKLGLKADLEDVEYWENGEAGTEDLDIDSTSTYIYDDEALTVVKTAANTYKFIEIDEDFECVTAVAKKAETTGDNAGKYKVTFSDGEEIYAEKDAYKVGEYYLIVWNWDTYDTSAKVFDILSIKLAEKVTGKVTALASNGSYIKVDNVQYNVPYSYTLGGYDVTPDVNGEYDFYLFSNGTVAEVTAPAAPTVEEVAESVIYVVSRASKAGKATGTDLYGKTDAVMGVEQVQVIDIATGAVSVVNTALALDKYGNTVYLNKYGKATTDTLVDTSGAVVPVGGFYMYTALEDGTYVFNSELTDTNALSLVKGNADVGLGKTKLATAATVVTKVITKVDAYGALSASISTTTGYANFPQTAAEPATAWYVTNAAGTQITAIFYQEGYVAPVTKTYGLYLGAGEVVTGGVMQKFYQDGEVVEYLQKTGEGSALTAGALYDLSVQTGALVFGSGKTAIVDPAVSDTYNLAQWVDVVDSAYFMRNVGSSAVWYYADNCTVVEAQYAADGTTIIGYEEGTVEKNDIIRFYANAAGKVIYIVILGEHTTVG